MKNGPKFGEHILRTFLTPQNTKRSLLLFFSDERTEKMLVLERLFWIPNDFSERTERKERRVAESEAEGCGVRSEAGVPFRGGLAEDVAARSGRRSDPKRVEWSEWRKRRRDPKNV